MVVWNAGNRSRNRRFARVTQSFDPGLIVCLTGPESTGKSTLAQELAAALGVPLVEEVAREILECREASAQRAVSTQDLLEIAKAQVAAEQAALAEGGGLVVCDTDLLVIKVWWQEKFGEPHPWLQEELAARTPRRYLLMVPDLPWEPDPLRDAPNDRHRLFDSYLSALRSDRFPFAEVFGEGSERFERAMACIQDWLSEPEYS